MSVHITKFTKVTSCGQCFATDRATEGVPTTSVDLTDVSAIQFKEQVQMMQAPILIVRDAETAEIVDLWSGFRPDKIKEYKGNAVPVSEDDNRFTEIPESNPLAPVTVVA